VKRRSGLQTVRRVAELREAGARNAVAAATQARADAERAVVERLAQLEASTLPGGSAGDLIAAAEVRSRLAAASTQARREVAEKEVRRREAVSAWSAASRRTSVLTGAVDRQRAEHDAAQNLDVQRMLDDLAARRRP
jgi:flagellar biosynthesis chaperone FliJ